MKHIISKRRRRLIMGKKCEENKTTCNNYFKSESVEERNEAFTRLWAGVINQKENYEVISFGNDSILHSQIS